MAYQDRYSSGKNNMANYQENYRNTGKGNSQYSDTGFSGSQNKGSQEAHAPYNFIPFTDDVIVRYPCFGGPEGLPAHNRLDDRLLTGSVSYTLKAETPVFVSNGEKDAPRFYTDAEGKYAIPGASIRGMVRANVTILGCGMIHIGEDIEHRQLYYRGMALAGKYHSAKEIYNETIGENHANVKAGYLHCSGRNYWISPATDGYISVERGSLHDFDRAWEPASVPAWYKTDAGGQLVEAKAVPFPGARKGAYHTSGRIITKKHDFLFTAENTSQSARVPLSEEDVMDYKRDLELRRTTLRGNRGWDLPRRPDELQCVFYLQHEQNGRRHTYFGSSPYLRIAYLHSIEEGLPARQVAMNAAEKQKRETVLDYPMAIFGMTGGEDYKSRVSFEDAKTDSTKCTAVHLTLAGPKPSFYAGYLLNNKTYNDDDFRLRGYKQYWLKDPETAGDCPNNKNIGSELKPLETGTEFHGIIHFHNLHEDELGLLLWALLPQAGYYQQIGQGKPYGYGRASLTVDNLTVRSPSALYYSDDLCATEGKTQTVDYYIEKYKEYAAEKLKMTTPFDSRPDIQDFLYMRSTIRNDRADSAAVRYLTLREHRNCKYMPTVQKIREGGNNQH